LNNGKVLIRQGGPREEKPSLNLKSCPEKKAIFGFGIDNQFPIKAIGREKVQRLRNSIGLHLFLFGRYPPLLFLKNGTT
jgi:hypothetical protein